MRDPNRSAEDVHSSRRSPESLNGWKLGKKGRNKLADSPTYPIENINMVVVKQNPRSAGAAMTAMLASSLKLLTGGAGRLLATKSDIFSDANSFSGHSVMMYLGSSSISHVCVVICFVACVCVCISVCVCVFSR